MGVGIPLRLWVGFVGSDSGECVIKSMVVKVLGDVVGPVSKCVVYGFTGIHEDRCPILDEVFQGGHDLH